MNNVEALEEFITILKRVHPNTEIGQREEMLLGMAINHAYLIKREEIEELRKEIERYKHDAEIKFIVEDEGGYKHGSFSEYTDAEEHAQEIADDRRIDLFIKKTSTGIAGCVIPD